MVYNSDSIYWIYFLNSYQIRTIQDLELDMSYEYEKIKTIAEKEVLFSFPKLQPFFDGTFNTPIQDKKLPTIFPISLALYLVEENSNPFFDYFLDDKSLSYS